VYHDVRLTAQKIARRLALIMPLVYRHRAPLPDFKYQRLDGPESAPPIGPEIDTSGWETVAAESMWGEWRENFILRTTFFIPADWPSDMAVALYLPLGEVGDFSHPEALAYIDGEAYAGCDRHHQEIRLAERWRDGQAHQLALHGWTGGQREKSPRPWMRTCQVVAIDQTTRDFTVLARVALEAAEVLDGDDGPAHDRLLNALDAAFKVLATREPFGGAFYASVPEALRVLREGIAQAGPPLDVDITGVGHAHIDVAWLWTLGQTRRKAGRTFHTVLRLMEQFPGYGFTQSQPQLYDFVRQDYPALFEAIQARVAEGRWEPIGGMWVEADCNLSGPESLARQFLLGRTFFREHFGPDAESPVLWLPDVFGYAWALPQLIKQAGLDYFFTIKIGWNQYNRLPYDSFWWEGIDGTRVLTHFSTTQEDVNNLTSRATYNAFPSPRTALGTWINSQHKEAQREFLMSYGYGDGGGGPTREMLENIGALETFPALPRMSFGRVGEFFRHLEAESGSKLPTWNGELYLELHRGTYTTQGRNKRANRKSEFLLHDAEFLAVLAGLIDPNYIYPTESLHRAWELVCLNQFHDIIPGSSITDVYTQSQQQYAEVFRLALETRQEALLHISEQMSGDLLVANTTAFTRDDLVFWPDALPEGAHLTRDDGQPVHAQPCEDGVWIAAGELPPYSVTPLTVVQGESEQPESGVTATPTLLENAFLRVELNEAGDIIRVYDKANGREVLPPGAIANQLQAFEDRPINWDAWDIDIFYDDRMWLAEPAESVRVLDAGPLRGTLTIKRRILNSTVTQRIALGHHSPRLDFDTQVDWQERHILLKVAFPVDVLSPVATYEIQWGNVQRPTHRNTNWDWARFETVAQKWVDLSEGNYGVSLLNDCKYGHDIQANVMRLSLLRAPTEPDPQADLGEHRFTYSLFPHAGGWDADTIRAAYALNDPLVVAPGGGRADRPDPAVIGGLLSVDQPNVIIETIKRAEDGRGLIVRLYESQRCRGPVRLKAGFPLAEAWEANLIETDQAPLTLGEDGGLTLPLRPFQIVTLRLIGM
jgi:alpha-mannosidase